MEPIIKTLIDKINHIQGCVFARGYCESSDKDTFKKIQDELIVYGYRLKKCPKGDIFHRWKVVSNEDIAKRRNKLNGECEYVYTNVRPSNRKTLKGDCTTRAMAYCLNGIMSYDEIEEEQYKLAKQMGTRRNATGTWDAVILNKDYCKMNLKNKIKRSCLGFMLRDVISYPIISLSSGHVAVIDVGGIVRDTWDSRGGKVDVIYCKRDDYICIHNALNTFIK